MAVLVVCCGWGDALGHNSVDVVPCRACDQETAIPRIRAAPAICGLILTAGFVAVALATITGVRGPGPARSAASAGQWRTLAGERRDAATTESFLQETMREHGVVALSVAIVDGDAAVFERTFGAVERATGKPATQTTVFRAASLSKPVFAYLVMKLADEGLLDLDTPLHKYLSRPLPAYPAYASFANDRRYERLTARLLLSHQGGLPNWRRVRPDGWIDFHSDPGSRFAYSGEGYALLQFVLEELSGRTLAALARDKVFGPLGMSDTSFLWESRFDGRFAVDLDSGLGPLIARSRVQANAAGSLITNASDYARFLRAVSNGTGLKPQTRAAMVEPQVALTSASLFSPPGTDGGANAAHEMAWALGWGRFQDAHGAALFHVGREEGCENYVQVSLDRKLGVCFFSLTTSPRSFSAPLVSYAMGGSYSPFEWLEYTDAQSPRSLGGGWRLVLLGLLAGGVALGILMPRIRRWRHSWTASNGAPPRGPSPSCRS